MVGRGVLPPGSAARRHSQRGASPSSFSDLYPALALKGLPAVGVASRVVLVSIVLSPPAAPGIAAVVIVVVAGPRTTAVVMVLFSSFSRMWTVVLRPFSGMEAVRAAEVGRACNPPKSALRAPTAEGECRSKVRRGRGREIVISRSARVVQCVRLGFDGCRYRVVGAETVATYNCSSTKTISSTF